MPVRKLIPLIAILVACKSVPTISELPATIVFKFGQDVQLLDPDVVIRFIEVIQDSRCPVNVQCVQAGSATLRFTIIEPDNDQFTVVLETDGPPQISDGLTFRLISVDPAPRAGQFLDPKTYTATVEVSQ